MKKDTCNKCDFFENKKLFATDEEKLEIENQQKAHHEKAEELQKQLKIDMHIASENPTVETLTFDLQKTLPLLRIPTNIFFYKRQL